MAKFKKHPRILIDGIDNAFLDRALLSSFNIETLKKVVSDDKNYQKQLKLLKYRNMDSDAFTNTFSLNLQYCYDCFNQLMNAWNKLFKLDLMEKFEVDSELSTIDKILAYLEELHNERKVNVNEIICYVWLVKKEWHGYLKKILENFAEQYYIENKIKLGTEFHVSINYEQLDKNLLSQDEIEKKEEKSEQYELLQEKYNKLEKILEKEKTKFKDNLGKKDTKIKELRDSKNELNQELTKVKNEQKKLTRENEKYCLRIKELENVVKHSSDNTSPKVDKLKREFAALLEELKESEKTIKQYAVLVDSLEAEVIKLRAQKDELSNQVDLLNGHCQSLDETLNKTKSLEDYSIQSESQESHNANEELKNYIENNPVKIEINSFRDKLKDELFAEIVSELRGVIHSEIDLALKNKKQVFVKSPVIEDPNITTLQDEVCSTYVLERKQTEVLDENQPLRFERVLKGGVIPEINAYVPEKIIMKLDLQHGDLVTAKLIERFEDRPDKYEYSIVERTGNISEYEDIHSIECGIVGYEPQYGTLGIRNTVFSNQIECDGEVHILKIWDRDIQEFDLREGDIVNAAFYKKRPEEMRIRHKYSISEYIAITESAKQLNSRKKDETSSYAYFKADIEPIFEGKRICIIGFEPGHSTYKNEIQKRKGEFIGVGGDAPDRTLKSNLLKSDVVIFMQSHMGHAVYYEAKDICKQYKIPFTSVVTFGLNAVLNAVEYILERQIGKTSNS
ncbi:MAG: hypothetical protein K0R71_2227 [Bacillales bacterium]|nr:hypothetical protein [Bacillales bacterium]